MDAGVEATDPRYYSEYAPDHYATIFEDPVEDPDGSRPEVIDFREQRRRRMYDDRAVRGNPDR